MKLPLRIKETLYYDSETGKPIGSEYWVFDDAAEELFVINDDEEAARRIVACVNFCEGEPIQNLEDNDLNGLLKRGEAKIKQMRAQITEQQVELDRLRQQNAELLEALKGIIEIGKRDMSNPKYDGCFNAARAAIAEAEKE